MVIGFSGKIKSGKTTISQAVASNLGFLHASFGGFVRSVAKDRGLDTNDREILQGVGESLIESGWIEFCTAVLESANWQEGNSVVVDGIRHERAIETIKTITKPQPFCLIYVEVDDSLRLSRLGNENTSLARIDAHSTEADVKNVLRSLADKTVDGSKELSDLVNEIVEFVSTSG